MFVALYSAREVRGDMQMGNLWCMQIDGPFVGLMALGAFTSLKNTKMTKQNL